MNLTEGVPAWVLRGVVLGAVLVIVILLLAQGVEFAGLIGLFGLLAAFAPASPAPALVIVATAVSAAISVDDPVSVPVLVLLPLVHLVHIGSALAAVIPGTARVHPSALRPAAIRFVVTQAAVFALAGVGAVLPKAVTPAVLEVLGLLGAAVLAVVAAKLILQRPQ
jgi:hypothetical protein